MSTKKFLERKKSSLNGQNILVFIKKQKKLIKIWPVNNFTSLNSNGFEVSDNSGNLLGTENALGVLVKVSQFCSCFTLTQHVGYHSSCFLISFSKETFFFRNIWIIFRKKYIKIATKRPYWRFLNYVLLLWPQFSNKGLCLLIWDC